MKLILLLTQFKQFEEKLNYNFWYAGVLKIIFWREGSIITKICLFITRLEMGICGTLIYFTGEVIKIYIFNNLYGIL